MDDNSKLKTNPPIFTDEMRSDPVVFAQQLLKLPNGNPVLLHDTQKQFLRGIKPDYRRMLWTAMG